MTNYEQVRNVNKPAAATQKQQQPTRRTDPGLTRQQHPAAIIQRATAAPESLTTADVLQLQRTIGNRAVGQLLSGIGAGRHETSAHESLIQAKLTINPPGDVYEQEADRVAGQVVDRINQPASQPAGQGQAVQRQPLPEEEELLQEKMIQRQPEEEEELLQGKMIDTIQRQELEDEEELQMMPIVQREPDGGIAATPDPEAAIQRARGSGQPLSRGIRAPMEQAFGADFDGVRVHTGAESDLLNRSIQARAFTTGQDVFFRQGAYDPGSRGGQELLAHELTHVVQQTGERVQQTVQTAGMRVIQRDKLAPGKDLPKIEDMTKKRFEELLAGDIGQTYKARQISEAKSNIEDRSFTLKIFNDGVKIMNRLSMKPPVIGDLEEIEQIIEAALDGASDVNDAQQKAYTLLERPDERNRKKMVEDFFYNTMSYSIKKSKTDITATRGEKWYLDPMRYFEHIQDNPDLGSYLEPRNTVSVDSLTKAFLDIRPDKMPALPNDQKAGFADALKQITPVRRLLTYKTAVGSHSAWKGGGSLNDVNNITESEIGNEDVKGSIIRKKWDDGTFAKRVGMADQFIKSMVEPQLLAQIPVPKIFVHLKHAGGIFTRKRNTFRAHQSGDEVHVAQDEETSVIVHEVGHYLEDNLPSELWHDIRLLLESRAGGETKVERGGVGMREEGRYPGEYPATGKYTSSAYPDKGSTEVMSMTLEYLSDPKKIKKMIENDPQQAAIILRGIRPKEYAETKELRQFDDYLTKAPLIKL